MYQATRSHMKQHANLHSSQQNLKFHIVILGWDDFKQGTNDRKNEKKSNFSNTLVLLYPNIRRHVREESNFHSHRSRNLRSQVTLFFNAFSQNTQAVFKQPPLHKSSLGPRMKFKSFVDIFRPILCISYVTKYITFPL